MLAMLKRAHITVIGQVQGIGYRYFALKMAKQLGVLGWVKNVPTGEVELMVEGEESALKTYAEALRNNHPWAKVTDIGFEWQNYEGDFQTFEIAFS